MVGHEPSLPGTRPSPQVSSGAVPGLEPLKGLLDQRGEEPGWPVDLGAVVLPAELGMCRPESRSWLLSYGLGIAEASNVPEILSDLQSWELPEILGKSVGWS
jgi:hypothetical protein